MVSSAPMVAVRVQHPLQSGVAPATLWILNRILNLTFLIGVLWAVPTAAKEFPDNIGNWVVWGFVATLATLAVSTALNRACRNRTPGALRWYAANEAPRNAWAPGIISDLVEVAVVASALPFLISRGDSVGTLAGVLGFLGGSMCLFGVRNAVGEVRTRLPGRASRAVWLLAAPLPMAITLCIGGLAAPGAAWSFGPWFWAGVLIGVVRIVWGLLARPVDLGLGDTLDEVADGLTARTSVAPTIRERARSRAIVRAAAIALPIALIGSWWLIASI